MLTRDDSSAAEVVDVVLAAGATSPATVGSDFTAGPITISFGIGESTKPVPIELLGETTVELDETIGLSLTNFTGSGLAGTTNPTSTLTINNDDVATLSISDATPAFESDTGTPQLVFRVTLDSDVDVPVDVDYATQDGTAKTGDSDYVGQTGTLNFLGNAGEFHDIAIDVTGDFKVELDEQLFVSISNIQASGRDVQFPLTTTGTTGVFSDHSAFVAAASANATLALETFDSFATNATISSLPALGIEFDEFPGGGFPIAYNIVACGGVTTTPPQTLVNRTSGCAEPGAGDFVFRPIDTNTGIIGVGFYNAGPDDALRLSFFDEMDNLIEQADVGFGPAFVGIVTSSPAARFEVTPIAGNGLIAFDNLEIAIANNTDSSGTGTILNDDSATVSINDVSQVESDSPGTSAFDFTITLSQQVDTDVTLTATTADGTINPAITTTTSRRKASPSIRPLRRALNSRPSPCR